MSPVPHLPLPGLSFTAVDVETANPKRASVCAVGVVKVRDGVVVDRLDTLVQPPPGHGTFGVHNVRVHGITAQDVLGAPAWDVVHEKVRELAGDDVLVAHNAGFDMAVIKRACDATGDEFPAYRYACSLQVARKVYRLDSYRLPFVAAEAGFAEFAHHNATADALACAHVMVDAAHRVGAGSIDELAEAVGVRVSQLATAEAPAVSFAVA